MAEPDNGQERDVLAAELALGVLVGDERAEALRLQLGDPAFAALVERWNLHFAALCVDVPPAEVPDRLWRAIEGRLDSRGGEATARALRFWRAAALLAGTAAAALAIVLVASPEPQPRVVTVPAAWL